MSSYGTPSSSDTSWANVVSWPWPCGNVPVVTTTLPVRWTLTLALSQSPAPHPSPPRPIHLEGATPQTSTYVDNPIPSSLEAPSLRRLACSTRRSLYPTASSALSMAVS